jgi:hypothetical protein
MKFKKIIIISSALTLLFSPVLVLAVSPPTIPLLVYGDVSLYGVTVPAGTIISVSKDSTTVATTTVNSAGKYFFEIPASYTGSLLTYKIGSLVVAEKVCADPMVTGSDRIDLIIGAAPVSPPSGGGGGGSYTPPSTTTPATTTSTNTLTPEQQKVDANKDNKIDVLDFNSLMINWGKTGTGNIADFNSDGKVDIFDFNMLMINWGK